MKKSFFILFWLITISLNATTFYVSPTGTNGAYPTRGTFANPWKTWGYAFNSTSVLAGDTVYFRGGIYYKDLTEDAAYLYGSTTGYMISRDGAVGDTLCYFAYPGETPILDCYNATTSANWNWGIYYGNINYVKLKGLHIRNIRQIRDQACFGAEVGGNGLVIENCKFYNIWGTGMRVSPGAGQSTYITNCDAYNCCDSLSAADPGNDGYGFSVIDAIGSVYFEGCRAWNCGDDGFNSGILQVACNTQYTEYNNCWSFRNGMMEGGGSGFKMGWHSYTDGNLKRVYNNCVAAYNRWNGWKTNDYYSGTYAIYCHVYNCIAYHNGWQGGVEFVSAGFEIHNVPTDDANETLRILKNNISYDNEGGAVLLSSGAKYTHDHNDWDIPLTLTDADFISVDSTGITAARQSDGSLPDNDCYNYFLRLSDNSQAIDKGTDVGLPYDGDAPDLGFSEYAEPSTGIKLLKHGTKLLKNGTKFLK